MVCVSLGTPIVMVANYSRSHPVSKHHDQHVALQVVLA